MGGDRNGRQIEVGDDFPGQAQGVIIVLCEIVGDARDPCMHICTAERLGADFLPSGRLH